LCLFGREGGDCGQVEVSLDGILQARTPMTQMKVPAGTYRLGVSCKCPDFEDAYHCQLVCDAVLESARTGSWMKP